jgi:hypothetical protein
MGGAGTDGDILLFPGGGVSADDTTATIHLNADGGDLKMGGAGASGDLFLFAGNGDQGNNDTAVVKLSSSDAALRLGGSGTNGDVYLYPSTGTHSDDQTATIHINAATGDILLRNADCAEEFDIETGTEIVPGAVVVLGGHGAVRPCTAAYDHCVAGVISGAGDYQPGLVLDKRPTGSVRLPVALMGKVFCLVDASHDAVRAGDLLTTSDVPGHAMKATDRQRAFGTILGKALKPLATGRGLIPILVTLQ